MIKGLRECISEFANSEIIERAAEPPWRMTRCVVFRPGAE